VTGKANRFGDPEKATPRNKEIAPEAYAQQWKKCIRRKNGNWFYHGILYLVLHLKSIQMKAKNSIKNSVGNESAVVIIVKH
jgi:hypothetical protein